MKNKKTKKQIRNAALSSRDLTRPAAACHQENPLFAWLKISQHENYEKLKRIAHRYTPALHDVEDLVHEIARRWPVGTVCPTESDILGYFTTCCRNLGYRIAKRRLREPELDAMVAKLFGSDRLTSDGEPLPAVQLAEEIFRDARNVEELREGLNSLFNRLLASRATLPAGQAKFLGFFRDAADLQAAFSRSLPQVPMARKLGLSQAMFSKRLKEAAQTLRPMAQQEMAR